MLRASLGGLHSGFRFDTPHRPTDTRSYTTLSSLVYAPSRSFAAHRSPFPWPVHQSPVANRPAAAVAVARTIPGRLITMVSQHQRPRPRTSPLLCLSLACASVVEAALTLQAPATLTTCQPASFNWTGGLPYYTLNVGPQGNTNLEQYVLTTKAYDWQVDYPAGTIVNVRLDSGAAYAPAYSYSGSMIVQAGTDNSCVPASHQNLSTSATLTNPTPLSAALKITFTTVPTNLSSCTSATWAWTGGSAPYTVTFIALDSAGMADTFTTNSPTYTWAPTYPGGVTLLMTVAPGSYVNSQQAFFKTMYIYNGTDSSCVTQQHLQNATRTSPPPYVAPVVSSSTRSPKPTATAFVSGNRATVQNSLSAGAIAGIVVGILGLGLIYLSFFIIRRRQQRNKMRFGNDGTPSSLMRLDSIEVEQEQRPVLGGRQGPSTGASGSSGAARPAGGNAPSVLRK
ncbi:BQ5605_C007g04660 [Microbotryum silenes-dioicae]|uniref:BQ5605_C007g04660 protein n=1 Tax=Microbotryum silenes-dioicae TaxID=796604 RepID=A0A2X0M7P4_9BASI|nr:BQ5605_C007g04660 [Microbotryum silenes-dioicae]